MAWPKELKTDKFKELHKAIKKQFFRVTFYIPGVDELLSEILYPIESWYLDELVRLQVDKAIEDYHKEMDKIEPDLVTPVYQEKESGIEGFPEMSLTAPWYKP